MIRIWQFINVYTESEVTYRLCWPDKGGELRVRAIGNGSGNWAAGRHSIDSIWLTSSSEETLSVQWVSLEVDVKSGGRASRGT